LLPKPVRLMSLGQRMRAEIAAALVHKPRILYLDEPTIGLDVIGKQRIRQMIRSANAASGTTVLLTTHDLTDIEDLCSRVIMIDGGRLVYDGGLPELLSSLGATGQSQLNRIVTCLQELLCRVVP
ncbi:ATP-binding cassette domain-containing protein, partial [Nostoc sp. HG1]|nr:ATP-binding cassette domain-containing protein [Nostoc sp. HG1]